MKYLGVDYGEKKIGLAISNSDGTVAMPYKIIETQFFLKNLENIIKKEKIKGIVFGESKNLLGKDNYINLEIKKKAKICEKKFNLPIFFESEIFTSMESRWGISKDIRRAEKKSRKPNKKNKIDDKAATLILQSFLNKK
ncbi:MAG: Holliday junction resolvase RuvX [Candidatus Pacebacteria bacterium]|nr:Holliday junction resolvase RuvX [Candidatus Paceibacterota bacterium]